MVAPEDRVESVPDRIASTRGGGAPITAMLVTVFIADFAIVVALVGALRPIALTWVVPLVVLGPPALLWALHRIGWAPLQRRFPPQPQRRDAVVHGGQSFRFGSLMRYNNCLHLAADDEHLHVIPFAPLQWFGARVISLPWSAFTDVRRKRARSSTMTAKVDGVVVEGPAWALALAEPEPSGAHESPASPLEESAS